MQIRYRNEVHEIADTSGILIIVSHQIGYWTTLGKWVRSVYTSFLFTYYCPDRWILSRVGRLIYVDGRTIRGRGMEINNCGRSSIRFDWIDQRYVVKWFIIVKENSSAAGGGGGWHLGKVSGQTERMRAEMPFVISDDEDNRCCDSVPLICCCCGLWLTERLVLSSIYTYLAAVVRLSVAVCDLVISVGTHGEGFELDYSSIGIINEISNHHLT